MALKISFHCVLIGQQRSRRRWTNARSLIGGRALTSCHNYTCTIYKRRILSLVSITRPKNLRLYPIECKERDWIGKSIISRSWDDAILLHFFAEHHALYYTTQDGMGWYGMGWEFLYLFCCQWPQVQRFPSMRALCVAEILFRSQSSARVAAILKHWMGEKRYRVPSTCWWCYNSEMLIIDR